MAFAWLQEDRRNYSCLFKTKSHIECITLFVQLVLLVLRFQKENEKLSRDDYYQE